WRNSMCRRCRGEYVHDETFVVTGDSEVHRPFMFGRPMPIQDVLTAASIPIPLYLAPQFIDLCGQSPLLFITIFEVLTDTEQSLNQECGFNEITTVVARTERFDFTRFTVHPVWPCAMKTIGLTQPVDEFIQPFETLLPCDKVSLDTHQNRHHTKSCTARRYNVLVVLRIHIIRMKTLTGSTGRRLCTIPEI